MNRNVTHINAVKFITRSNLCDPPNSHLRYDVSNFAGTLIAMKEPNVVKLLLLIQINTKILIETQFNCHENNQYYII